jgi:anaerobic selenocysteine-containing dehydrogenase
MSTIGDALLDDGTTGNGPKIEAVVVYNSNPVAVAPESGKVAAGFGRDDLFTVVLEHFRTDTADYADIVLPATTQLEHVDVHKAYGHTYFLANNQAVEPLGRRCRTPRSSAGWPRAWDSRSPALPTATRRSHRRPSCVTTSARRASAGIPSRHGAGRN